MPRSTEGQLEPDQHATTWSPDYLLRWSQKDLPETARLTNVWFTTPGDRAAFTQHAMKARAVGDPAEAVFRR
jgi:hypothetical protein